MSVLKGEESLDISVVVPISERHDDLHQLYKEHSCQLSQKGYSFEFIFVVDGPDFSDASHALMLMREEYPNIQVIAFNRPFGEATALSEGFRQAKGEIILTLASYFQAKPDELHRLLDELEINDYDLVISRRYPRIDSRLNRAQSRIFHWFIQFPTGTSYHDISCGLRAMKREVTLELPLYGDLHRFIPLLAHQRGFRISEVCVEQSPHDTRPRIYKPGVYLRRLLDILTLFFLFKFVKKPLRFFGFIGFALAGIGGLITGYLGIYRLLNMGPIANRPLLILGVLLIVLGLQLFSVGLLGEILIYVHAAEQEDYHIKEILN